MPAGWNRKGPGHYLRVLYHLYGEVWERPCGISLGFPRQGHGIPRCHRRIAGPCIVGKAGSLAWFETPRFCYVLSKVNKAVVFCSRQQLNSQRQQRSRARDPQSVGRNNSHGCHQIPHYTINSVRFRPFNRFREPRDVPRLLIAGMQSGGKYPTRQSAWANFGAKIPRKPISHLILRL
jgi:hypothetical protein